jgi:hypothetical protein
MAGLDPAIQFLQLDQIDSRLKAGHDKGGVAAP